MVNKKRSDSKKREKRHVKSLSQQFENVPEGQTECKNNADDLNQLKSTHLVSDRKKWFETMLSVDGPASECKKSKPAIITEASCNEDHLQTAEYVTKTMPTLADSPEEGIVDIPEEDKDQQNQSVDTQSKIEEVPFENHNNSGQEKEIDETPHYIRKKQNRTVDQKKLFEFRKSIKESIVQEFRDLSLDGMEELDGMDDEEASMCKSIIRSWSQQNLDVLIDEDDGDINHKIFETVSKSGQETEIEICINGIKEEYQSLATFGDGQQSERSSGRFIKNGTRLSGSRRSYKMRKSKATEITTFVDDSDSDGVIDYTKEDSTVRNSIASSSAYESGDEETDFDIFGFTNFNDYAVEAYNPQFYENILFKISLCREMIEIPDIDQNNVSNLRRQSKIFNTKISLTEENSEKYEDHNLDKPLNDARGKNIYENCVPLNSHAGNVEYDLMNVKSVEDATCKMKKHIYENHMISNNDNVVGGAYLDENLNSRIEIICDSNPEPEKQSSLEVPTRLNTQLSSPTPKQQHIMKELIDTEIKYIENMEYVIHQYLRYFLNHPKRRRELPGISAIFGNIESLYESSKKILEDLIKCDSSVDCIANIFLQSRELFVLYADYMRNKSQTQATLETFRTPLTERQRELNDKKSCDSYLLTPVQRPGRYKLLLESLQKELRKSGEENKCLEAAIRFVDQNIMHANTLLAVDSINGSPIDLSECGSFLLKETFNIKRKYKSVVFLFEGIIVFTTDNKYKSDTYDYKNSINANDLTLQTHNKSTTFIVRDFPKCKHTDDGRFSFEIETSAEHVCKKWVNEIGGILWNQLSHFRQLQDKQREAPKLNSVASRKEVKDVKQKRGLDRTSSVFYVPNE